MEADTLETKKVGIHCIHVGSASAKDLVDLSKHYIHEIDTLVSLDRAECFALDKKKHKTRYIVVQKLSVYEDSVSMGFKCTKYILFHVMR